LQTTLKQKFAYSFPWMWLTYVSEKNKITFEPSQPPYKLNQNKSVLWHKKPPMTQKFHNLLTQKNKN
jgi:hypothetical protein